VNLDDIANVSDVPAGEFLGKYNNLYTNVCLPFPLFFKYNTLYTHDMLVPSTTGRRVIGLWTEERPADVEGSCEHIE
jgi:hypothetical protein